MAEKTIKTFEDAEKAIEELKFENRLENRLDMKTIDVTYNRGVDDALEILRELKANHEIRTRQEITGLLDILSNLVKIGTLGQGRLLFEIEQFERRLLEGEK